MLDQSLMKSSHPVTATDRPINISRFEIREGLKKRQLMSAQKRHMKGFLRGPVYTAGRTCIADMGKSALFDRKRWTSLCETKELAETSAIVYVESEGCYLRGSGWCSTFNDSRISKQP